MRPDAGCRMQVQVQDFCMLFNLGVAQMMLLQNTEPAQERLPAASAASTSPPKSIGHGLTEPGRWNLRRWTSGSSLLVT